MCNVCAPLFCALCACCAMRKCAFIRCKHAEGATSAFYAISYVYILLRIKKQRTAPVASAHARAQYVVFNSAHKHKM